MEDPDAPTRRSYDASGRRAAAETRRQRVVDAAAELFPVQGWRATTIATVAAQAGVSPELVSKTFGGKQELLMAAMRSRSFNRGLPLPQAFAALHLEDEPDREVRLDRVVAFVVASLEPMAPFVPVMIQGADQDPRMRVILDAARDGHLVATQDLVRHVATGPLHPDAVDVVYVLTRAETYLTLVPHRGWTSERYATWLRRAIDDAVRPVRA
ncbi:DNA-binding transcriptional regulator, AcrR family [Nocardioides exalbidus]|uniref:DNA-binding transcriptional regulator, AcrR family n=1 Tax=Nocardioides exalbidus TaxID=402596 RepID=A0A1H4T6A2_9ACTN|nr:TetR/AcrR family transcriptional regulator [Nocardioides exalbidus]SEC51808.1 DNA-binding transcriptional regulator, AcrR family [Nocardioides exalbidus]